MDKALSMIGSREMGAKTLISQQEYLETSYPDRAPEYVEGEVVERSVPNLFHSKAQKRVLASFERVEAKLDLFAHPELRIPVTTEKFRIADVVVYAEQEPTEAIPTQVPHVIVEIVSPDDRYEEIMTRLEEYRVWGVPHVWLVDPGLRRGYVYHEAGLKAVEAFQLSDFDVRIPLEEILR
ncbi:MAG: Uma2 family endonuclease [Acidimicrobiia bacterium]|nr:Uma2 family endonuclease [Acidimicrobiia bacterium]